METLPDSIDLTQRASVWNYHHSDGFVVTFPKPFKTSVEYSVSVERLAALHPELPQWWHARLVHFQEKLATANTMAVIPSNEELLETLNYLNHGGLEFDGAMGTRAVFTHMENLEQSLDNPDETIITGYIAYLIRKEVNGISVPCLTESHLVFKPLPTAYLSELYPGWSQRHASGVALGLESTELMEYTFSKRPSLDSRLPHVDIWPE